MRDYNLQGFSTIEYCVNDKMPPKDTLDIFAQYFFLILFIITLSSTFFDRYLRNKSHKTAHEFYNEFPKLKIHKFLTLFSIRRNWNYLYATPKDSENIKFQAIHGVRGLMVCFVILGHVFYFADFLPSSNPEKGEKVSQIQNFSRLSNNSLTLF